MEGISDIKIVGIDEKRPPRIRKEPYIDLYFKLSHKAPPDWCKKFNEALSKYKPSPKIDAAEGLYIETWVKTPDEIDAHLKLLQTTLSECTRQYIERIELSRKNSADSNADLQQSMGEQGRLNTIIAGLKFDKVSPQ